MKIISAENIKKKFKEKSFLIIGDEIAIINYIKKKILNYFKKEKFTEKTSIYIKKKNDWKKIYIFLIQRNIFHKKTILDIFFLKEQKKKTLFKNLRKILKKKNENILLIFNIKKNKKNNINYEYIVNKKILMIKCDKPNVLQTKQWCKKIIKKKKINIKSSGIEILIKYYKKNLLELFKIIDLLSLIYKKKKIKKKNILSIIKYNPNFKIQDLINALLKGKVKKSIKILKNLKKKINEPIKIVEKLQKKILQLIKIKIFLITKNKKYFIEIKKIPNIQKKNFLFALKKFNIQKLHKILNLLSTIEINFKNSFNKNIWFPLKILIFMFY